MCDGQTDGQTDRQTDIVRQHSPRYAIALRGKNQIYTWITEIPCV